MPKTESVSAVAYYRMSTSRQEASIPAQRVEVMAYAAKHGHRIIREYHDEGISGDETEKRAGFQQMIRDAAERGDFRVILCWDQDRFGRFDPLEAGYWIKPLRDAGVRLETVTQGKIDWEDFGGRLLWTVNQEAKHAYLRDLSRNVTRGMLKAAREGKWQGGKPPYGYRVENQRLVPGDPAEVEVVRWLFRTYADTDTSLRALVHGLNRRAVPSPGGGQWYPTPLRMILRCPHYLGILTWNRDCKSKYRNTGPRKRRPARAHNPQEEWVSAPNTHEPLIDRERWQKVQRKLEQRQKQTCPCTGGDRFLLTGLIVCGHCRSAMHGHTQRNPRNSALGVRRYLCSGYQTKGRAVCNHHVIHEGPLVECLVRKIQESFLNRVNLIRLQKEIDRQLDGRRQGDPARVRHLRTRLVELDRQIDRGNVNLALLPADLIEGVIAQVRVWMAE